jgi:hypothetical protein
MGIQWAHFSGYLGAMLESTEFCRPWACIFMFSLQNETWNGPHNVDCLGGEYCNNAGCEEAQMSSCVSQWNPSLERENPAELTALSCPCA